MGCKDPQNIKSCDTRDYKHIFGDADIFCKNQASSSYRTPRVFGDKFGDRFVDVFVDSLKCVINLVTMLMTNFMSHQICQNFW